MISDWLNDNRHRAFPFREDSSFKTNAPASWSFPMSALVDFSLHDLTRELDEDWSVTMPRVGHDASGVYMEFLYRDMTFRCIVPSTSDEVVSSPVEPVGDIPQGVYIRGTARVCPFSVPASTVYTFATPPEILPTRVVHLPLGRGVTSISAYNASGTRVTVGGDDELPIHVGPNCYSDLRIYDDGINLEISETAGLGQCCQSQSLDDSCKNKLLFINGQIANSSGNIDFEAGPGITVRPSGMTFIPELGTSVPSVTIKASPSLKAFLT